MELFLDFSRISRNLRDFQKIIRNYAELYQKKLQLQVPIRAPCMNPSTLHDFGFFERQFFGLFSRFFGSPEDPFLNFSFYRGNRMENRVL